MLYRSTHDYRCFPLIWSWLGVDMDWRAQPFSGSSRGQTWPDIVGMNFLHTFTSVCKQNQTFHDLIKWNAATPTINTTGLYKPSPNGRYIIGLPHCHLSILFLTFSCCTSHLLPMFAFCTEVPKHRNWVRHPGPSVLCLPHIYISCHTHILAHWQCHVIHVNNPWSHLHSCPRRKIGPASQRSFTAFETLPASFRSLKKAHDCCFFLPNFFNVKLQQGKPLAVKSHEKAKPDCRKYLPDPLISWLQSIGWYGVG